MNCYFLIGQNQPNISNFRWFNLIKVELLGHFRITGFYQIALQNGFAIYIFFYQEYFKESFALLQASVQNDYSSPTEELLLCAARQVSFCSAPL